MNLYLWVALGSAIGGVLRFALGRALMPAQADGMPWGTLLINCLGSFVIGLCGTLTVRGARWEVSEAARIFVMVGLCGGFTTFSAFSLETFELLRGGAWGRALLNAGLSVLLCLGAVALGHWVGRQGSQSVAVIQVPDEEYGG